MEELNEKLDQVIKLISHLDNGNNSSIHMQDLKNILGYFTSCVENNDTSTIKFLVNNFNRFEY